MKNAKALFFVAATTFVGGYMSGLLSAPDSGRASRRRIAEKAQAQRQRLGEHLRSIEEQLSGLERDLHLLGQRFSNQLRPTPQEDTSEDIAWEVDPDEVTRELRGMPRR